MGLKLLVRILVCHGVLGPTLYHQQLGTLTDSPAKKFFKALGWTKVFYGNSIQVLDLTLFQDGFVPGAALAPDGKTMTSYTLFHKKLI